MEQGIDLVNDKTMEDDLNQDCNGNDNVAFNIPTLKSIHSAHDQYSKWSLSELFPEGLEVPAFINNGIHN